MLSTTNAATVLSMTKPITTSFLLCGVIVAYLTMPIYNGRAETTMNEHLGPKIQLLKEIPKETVLSRMTVTATINDESGILDAWVVVNDSAIQSKDFSAFEHYRDDREVRLSVEIPLQSGVNRIAMHAVGKNGRHNHKSVEINSTSPSYENNSGTHILQRALYFLFKRLLQ